MEKCGICKELMDASLNKPLYEIPECKHRFHLECIMTWFRSPQEYYDASAFGKCPLCRSKQNKDISEILSISLETVKTHIQNIRKKQKNYNQLIKSLL